MTYTDYKMQRPKHDGWYLRVENNGWRPVSHHNWMSMSDPVEIISANKV